MYKNRLLYYGWKCALLLAVLCAWVACSDEKFSTDVSYKLAFSTEELRFDTLITTVGSRTKTLTIYNRNKYGVRIPKVILAKGTDSPFRVNVDGQYLYNGEGGDFEIPGGDSIFARIEFTATITPGQDVEEVKDELLFTLENGTTQALPLHAGVMDAELIHGLFVESDMTLSSTRPIVVYDSLVVDTTATLTVAEGTTLMFHAGAGLDVRGTLKICGTLENPVTLRSDMTEHMFDSLYYDNTPNRWNGVRLAPCSKNNEISYCDLHASTTGIFCERDVTGLPKLRLENSVIHNLGADGLHLEGSRVYVANTQISNALDNCVTIKGGYCDFVHCTIAQFYPFDPDRGQALFIEGGALEDDSPDAPLWLEHAHFRNCVITGYGEDVIYGEIHEDAELRVDYLFSHCYLNTVESQDEVRFVNIIYDTDDQPMPREKNFVRFDTDNFIYDFTPADSSSIRGLADPLYAFPTDRLGRARREAGKADAGCYEGLMVADDSTPKE